MESPTAPARIDSRTSVTIVAISSAVAVRSDAASPIAHRRTAQWPTKPPRLMPTRPSRPSRKAPNGPPAKSTPSASAAASMPSTRDSMSTSQGTSAGFAGASVKPQLPINAVVTPCHDDGDIVGSKCACAS